MRSRAMDAPRWESIAKQDFIVKRTFVELPDKAPEEVRGSSMRARSLTDSVLCFRSSTDLTNLVLDSDTSTELDTSSRASTTPEDSFPSFKSSADPMLDSDTSTELDTSSRASTTPEGSLPIEESETDPFGAYSQVDGSNFEAAYSESWWMYASPELCNELCKAGCYDPEMWRQQNLVVDLPYRIEQGDGTGMPTTKKKRRQQQQDALAWDFSRNNKASERQQRNFTAWDFSDSSDWKSNSPRWENGSSASVQRGRRSGTSYVATNLTYLETKDDACVIAVKKITKLGFNAADNLRSYFEQWGPVEEVLLSSIPANGEVATEHSRRRRPPGMAWVVMKHKKDAQSIFSLGEVQVVNAAQIQVAPFVKRLPEGKEQATIQESIDESKLESLDLDQWWASAVNHASPTNELIVTFDGEW